MKWPGLTLVGYIGREEDPFERYHHMCFCDYPPMYCEQELQDLKARTDAKI